MNGDIAKGTTLREYLYVNGLQIVFTDDSNTQEEDTCSEVAPLFKTTA